MDTDWVAGESNNHHKHDGMRQKLPSKWTGIRGEANTFWEIMLWDVPNRSNNQEERAELWGKNQASLRGMETIAMAMTSQVTLNMP